MPCVYIDYHVVLEACYAGIDTLIVQRRKRELSNLGRARV